MYIYIEYIISYYFTNLPGLPSFQGPSSSFSASQNVAFAASTGALKASKLATCGRHWRSASCRTSGRAGERWPTALGKTKTATGDMGRLEKFGEMVVEWLVLG